jgi:hypothetical protein
MFIPMDRSMKDSGRTICKMVQEKKSLKMVVSTMECSKMERNGDKALINGPTVVFTLVIGSTIISKETVNITGQMAESTKEAGKRTSLTVRVSTTGLTEDDMTVTTKTIRSTALVHTTGQMEKLTKATG